MVLAERNRVASYCGSNFSSASLHPTPFFQVKLLQSLGLKSTLITDGSTPINLFNTAYGLLGLGANGQPPASMAASGPRQQEGAHPPSPLAS